jgi:hypothetical protein
MDCADIFAETGKRAIMRYQMDGAGGPQPECKLLDTINWEFDKSAVWILKFQPSNSPTNVKDCVSSQQCRKL